MPLGNAAASLSPLSLSALCLPHLSPPHVASTTRSWPTLALVSGRAEVAHRSPVWAPGQHRVFNMEGPQAAAHTGDKCGERAGGRPGEGAEMSPALLWESFCPRCPALGLLCLVLYIFSSIVRLPAPDRGREFIFSTLPSLIYPNKFLLQDEVGSWNFCPLSHPLGSGTDVPAPMHTFAALCGNSMTQLFSRLLASRFPHPLGPFRDFKVRKGRGLSSIPWEAEAVSQTADLSFYSALTTS